MFFYSKKSSRKIIHTEDCFRLRNVSAENIGTFQTLEEAYAKGYRLCRNCNPVFRQYRREKSKLTEQCQKYSASFFLHDKFFCVLMPHSRWKIVPSPGARSLLLYHQNTFEKIADMESTVPGYHRQSAHRSTLLGYLDYIVQHESYRTLHPLHIWTPKKKKQPPQKGTKRYKHEQLKAKKQAKRRAVNQVLALIDRLQMQQQPAG